MECFHCQNKLTFNMVSCSYFCNCLYFNCLYYGHISGFFLKIVPVGNYSEKIVYEQLIIDNYLLSVDRYGEDTTITTIHEYESIKLNKIIQLNLSISIIDKSKSELQKIIKSLIKLKVLQ